MFDFPNMVQVCPDIRIVAFEKELTIETRKVLDRVTSENRMCFMYDTTFSLSSFYTSVLTYLHPFLTTTTHVMPPIPFGYFFHELKHQKVHEYFWSFVAENFPEMESKAFMITDCETGKLSQ